MLKHQLILRLLILCSTIVALLGIVAVARVPLRGQEGTINVEPNLLINGNFDELPFYHMPPNHFIAGGWTRWWIHLTVLPEFDDVSKPGGVREHVYVDGGHAQVYFKWGHSYTAGIFQVVDGLTPCRPYEFTMHARTHSLPGAQPGSRIGLDPLGARLTTDGAVADVTPLIRAVWSREQTVLNTWEELSVTAEPRGTQLSAILYASPRPNDTSNTHFYDTFWDAGALHAIPYTNGQLPEASRATDGFIYDVTAMETSAGTLNLNWKLNGPATTQVMYSFVTPSTLTNTTGLTYTIYMPLITRFSLTFDGMLPVDYDAAALTRTTDLTGYTPGQIISYAIFARRLVGDTCITEFAGPYTFNTQP